MTEKKHELVRYANDLNEIQLHKLTASDLNFFYMLCARASDKKDETFVISLSDIRENTGYTAHGTDQLKADLMRMNEKLLKCSGSYENEEEAVAFNVFSTFRVNKRKKTLTVRVNPDFAFLLNDIVREFTAFELQDFVSLGGKYSKGLYKLLKQWKTQGHTKQYGVEELKHLLDTPDYAPKDLMRYIINPAMQEITEQGFFKNLTCEAVRGTGRGRPVVGYIFHFRPDERRKQPEITASRGEKKKKNAFTSIEQNNYDFDELEKKLMEAD